MTFIEALANVTSARFYAGNVVMTPLAEKAIEESKQEPMEFIIRHTALDRGELNNADYRANIAAVNSGRRIFGVYLTDGGDRLYLVTEGVHSMDMNVRQRELTTIMLAEEY